MLREIPLTGWFGWAWWNRLVGRPSPMADVKMSKRGYGFAIVDGARPGSRRMCAGLQYLQADQSG